MIRYLQSDFDFAEFFDIFRDFQTQKRIQAFEFLMQLESGEYFSRLSHQVS